MTSTRLALSGGAELALDCELVRRRSRRQLARRGDARSLAGHHCGFIAVKGPLGRDQPIDWALPSKAAVRLEALTIGALISLLGSLLQPAPDPPPQATPRSSPD